MAYLHKCDVCGDTAKWTELHGWVEMCWARSPEDAEQLDLTFCLGCSERIRWFIGTLSTVDTVSQDPFWSKGGHRLSSIRGSNGVFCSECRGVWSLSAASKDAFPVCPQGTAAAEAGGGEQ